MPKPRWIEWPESGGATPAHLGDIPPTRDCESFRTLNLFDPSELSDTAWLGTRAVGAWLRCTMLEARQLCREGVFPSATRRWHTTGEWRIPVGEVRCVVDLVAANGGIEKWLKHRRWEKRAKIHAARDARREEEYEAHQAERRRLSEERRLENLELFQLGWQGEAEEARDDD